MSDSEKKNLLNLVPQSIDRAFENLTDEPTKSIGRTLSDCWSLIFEQFSYLAEKRRIRSSHKLELFRQQLLEENSKIPDSKRIEPSFQTTAQALENSKYCIEEDDLRNMFVALISHSLNSDYQSFIHPSFSEIIKQMSSLDAKIIALFKAISLPGLPVCQYCLNIPGITNSAISVPEHIFLEIPDGNIQSNSMSLVSLNRLGLVAISYLNYLHDKTLYEKFSTHSFYKSLQEYCPIGKIFIKKGIVTLTPFGRSFVKVCVPD